MGVEIQLFEIGAYRSDFFLWGWMESEFCKEKVNTRDELVAYIMNSAAIPKQEHQMESGELHVLLSRELKS